MTTWSGRLAECSGGVDAVHAGHAVVHHDDGGIGVVRGRHRLDPARRLGDDVEPVELEHRAKHAAYVVGVVDHHHPDRPPGCIHRLHATRWRPGGRA
jgi:hypothetical protein